MALQYLGQLASFFAPASFSSTSGLFKLHTSFTVMSILGACLLLNAHELFGEPITCLTDLPVHVVNTYCWITSTFTIQDYSYREIGRLAAHPGVVAMEDNESVEERWKFHNYYQWVAFALLLQAGLFRLPKIIWESAEGNLMTTVCNGLDKTMYKDDDVGARKAEVLKYLTKHISMHNWYVFKYWLCEVLCLVNIVSTMFFMDWFLNGEFWQYGADVINFTSMDQSERIDPMIYVFPRTTKCNFHKYGSSGNIEKHDAICLLPLNILNEKIFIVEWIWFMVMTIAFSFLIIYRIFLMFSPKLRARVLFYTNMAMPLETLMQFTHNSSLGDWWVMYLVSQNIDPLIYKDILQNLCAEYSRVYNIKEENSEKKTFDRIGWAVSGV